MAAPSQQRLFKSHRQMSAEGFAHRRTENSMCTVYSMLFKVLDGLCSSHRLSASVGCLNVNFWVLSCFLQPLCAQCEEDQRPRECFFNVKIISSSCQMHPTPSMQLSGSGLYIDLKPSSKVSHRQASAQL